MSTLFPKNFCPSPAELPAGFLEFLRPLHRKYTGRQQFFASRRVEALQKAIKEPGGLPEHPRRAGEVPSEITDGDWKVQLPHWITDQRNQMTGPADDAELAVKMLNSGAPGVMLDLEDSMANTWECTKRGVANAVAALHGELVYEDRKRGRLIGINPSSTVTFIRVRGLHMSQYGVFVDEPVSASLFDAAMLIYGVDPDKLKHPLCLYIPKTEFAMEGAWWSDLLGDLARAKGMPEDWIKCMALVESHPLAYNTEEFIYRLKDHLIGLNLGRWDYMASLIHFTLGDPRWVLPDRNTIPHDVPFFQNLRELLVEVCHKRGIFAIGGMTALYPSRSDADLDARAKKALEQDKKNEARLGFDGAWTGHPDQNAIAVGAFPAPNQLGFRQPDSNRYIDLRPRPIGVGYVSLGGTQAAVRTVIRYRKGVLDGKGASLLDGYMEDLATDRIYRNMIAQRIRHNVMVEDHIGARIWHDNALIDRIFLDELHAIIIDPALTKTELDADRYTEAAHISRELIRSGECDPS